MRYSVLVLLLPPVICSIIAEPLGSASGPTVSTTSLPQVVYPYAYSITLNATGGVPPYQWQQCAVPGGTSFFGTLSAAGVLAFTSPQWPISLAGTTVLFGVSVTDSAGQTSACQPLSLYLSTGLKFLGPSTEPLNFNLGWNLPSYQLEATENFQPNTFALTGGSLPPGLSLSSAGVISGTPTQLGSYTFQVTVTDSTHSTATATITIDIVYGGLPPGVLESVTCTPQLVTSSGTVTCIATWGPNTFPDFQVIITNNNPFVTVTTPRSLSPSGDPLTLTFLLTVAPFNVNGTALIQVTGAGTASTTLILQAGPQLAGLSCAAAAVESKQATTCTASLQAPVSSDASVFLSALNEPITFPNVVVIPAGAISASFPVTALAVSNATPAEITAQCNSRSATASLTVVPSVPVSALACTPAAFSSPGTTACTVSLNWNAAVTGTTVALASDNANVSVPASVLVPAGQSTAPFTATAAAIANSQTANLTAASGDGRAYFSLSIGAAPKVSGLSCQPSSIAAGAATTCTVSLTGPSSGSYAVAIGSNNAVLAVPASVAVGANQSSATFQAKAGGAATQQVATVSASANGSVAQSSVTISAAAPPVLTAPATVSATLSAGAQFTVTASDPAGLPVTLMASGLPRGATFDAIHGQFTWSPDATQLGTSTVSITATNSAALSATKAVAIDVTDDIPVVFGVYNSASYATGSVCSPGALASIDGLLLTNQPAQIATVPWPTQLAGVRVLVNGTAAPLFYASPTLVDFECPYLASSTPLAVTLIPAQGATPPAVSMTAQAATPGLYILSNYSPTQGAVVIAPSGQIAMAQTGGVPSRPAAPGEYLEIFANGLGSVSAAVAPGSPAPTDQVVSLVNTASVTIGGIAAPAAFAGLAPGEVAMFQVNAQIPANAPTGPAVPVSISVMLPDGTAVTSNTVTVAIASLPAQ